MSYSTNNETGWRLSEPPSAPLDLNQLPGLVRSDKDCAIVAGR